MIELKEGDKAPSFSGVNQDGKTLKLSDFKGKRLILYFYPKDNTPGCTAESCNLNENYDELTKHGFEVLGVSPDEVGKHQKFIAKYNLFFNLIADTEREMLQAYGAWGEKKLYGKVYDGVLRTTFIISPDGVIEKIFKKVKTKDHTNQILTELGLEF
ncbi:peroxiredoxin Q/BCP [Ancylomarina subtilis]|uniref:thioredoxin-dependent peroxiredoxin n=1 Tax=Ancylomarina subtilis TaxID=1639035 RepID=A0A4Q7VL81_9BACT|nr:thioredoxin-dependent thiol peroxidase [Ancylomarina subtilis]RZT96914.1 peroxiredoxin Q/BCP [Ancylomarina subtilis]